MELNTQEEALLKEHLHKFSLEEKGPPIRSGLTELDAFFLRRGGIHYGKVIEWGSPIGRCGRFMILRFLRDLHESVVWIHGQKEELEVYAPAWAERGVDLSLFYFIRSRSPLPDLRPLFLEPAFKVIVMDCPERLSPGDWSFIASKVRENKQLLFVLRPFFLSTKRGNPLVSWRVNCWLKPKQGKYCLNFLKGGEGKIEIPMSRVRDT